jgi:hypothetical protein
MTATSAEATTLDSPPTSNGGTGNTSPIEGSLELKDETQEPSTTDLFLNMEPLEQLAAKKTISIPRSPNFSRKEVVQAFQTAFELIGGVPRLALWGHENPNEFYKLYGKLLPSSNSSALGEQSKLVIEMAIRPGALDE